ncbi:alcohol-forming fatty acyl-CoA reductase-like [Pistacia vera]|uniref:alcohol-forming fatty acyl-CoA reductase-like n=1 Tax=Pistacia vera TaxID=55513 RepID=UPI001262EA57|nr:alcohol-forming fatty acyl-CoA reductase-like [Pistacia vera]
MEFVNPLPFLKEKTILIIGATSFLGKVFVEKIMRTQPNVKKLYLLVRSTDAKSIMKRIIVEVEKDLFNVLRDKLGANFKFFISKKVVAVAIDVFEVNLGVKDSKLMEEMYKEIDLIVNFAATTDFDERYDFAFNVNTMGALNIMSFAKNCIKINMVLHVSTETTTDSGKSQILFAVSSQDLEEHLTGLVSCLAPFIKVQVESPDGATEKKPNPAHSYLKKVDKLLGFVEILSASGIVVTDEELLNYILDGLNSEYDAAVVHITTRLESKLDPLSVQEAQIILQKFELRLEKANLALNTVIGTEFHGGSIHLANVTTDESNKKFHNV